MEIVPITSQTQRFYLRKDYELFLLGLLLLLMNWGVYRHALNFPLTNWDDLQFIAENPVLNNHDRNSLRKMFSIGGVPGEKLYIPLTYLSFLSERMIFGMDPHVIHRDNLMLHMVNCLLVMGLFMRCQLPAITAFVGAGLWALHPVVVEPVVWAMGRKDLLAGFFGLLTLICFHIHVKSDGSRWWWAAFIFFGIGLLCKPTLIVMPGLLMLMLWHETRKVTKIQWIGLISFILVAAAIYGLNWLMPDDSIPEGLTWQSRLQGMIYVFTSWMNRFLLIEKPSPFYCWPDAEQLAANLKIGIPILLFMVIIVGLGLKRQWPLSLFGIMFVLVMFIPAGVVVWEGRDFITADRYGYFPAIGWWMAVAGTYKGIKVKFQPLYLGLLFLILLITAYQGQQHVPVWSNSIHVWKSALEECPKLVLAHNNLGMAYLDNGEVDHAITQFKRGLEFDPDYAPILKNLSRVYLDCNMMSEAEHCILPLVQSSQNDVRILKLWADILAQKNELENAIVWYDRVIQIDSGYISAYFGLGGILQKLRRYREASLIYQRALRVAPNNPDLLNNAGIVHEKLVELDEAIKVYTKAIQAKPDYVDAHFNLANLFTDAKKYSNAITHYQVVLDYFPHHVEALINLGNVYFYLNEWTLATQYYQKALAGKGNTNSRVHYNLGLIYSRSYDFVQALAEFTLAIKNDEFYGDAYHEAAKIYYRLNEIQPAIEHLERAKELGVLINSAFEKALNVTGKPGKINH
jgi:tetratricopeptide (TPR) repeat protein